MTDPTTEPTPTPATESAEPATPDSSGDQLGNVLIGAAILVGFILLLGLRYATSNNDDDDPYRRDAEVEFVQDRDEESEFARLTYGDDYYDDEPEPEREPECEYEDDDADAESRFADDNWCEPTTGGLFPDEAPRERDSGDFIDFDRLERPTMRADLADRNTSRLREIEVSLGPGRSDVDLALRNPGPVEPYGNGIAVRTETAAMLLSNTQFVTIRRPDDCSNGCSFTIWLTMGPRFQELHPDAELMLFAGDDADAWIDDISRLPSRVYR